MICKIHINDGFDSEAVNRLEQDGYTIQMEHLEGDQLVAAARAADVLVVRSATKLPKTVVDALAGSRLKCIVRAGVGLDNIDLEAAKVVGIDVRNTPRASSVAVAELTMAQMLNLHRRCVEAHRSMAGGKWEKKALKGLELYGKTLGLVGMGRIAQEVALRASAFGMRILYYTRSGEKSALSNYTYAPLETLLETSDVVSLHVPFDPAVGAILTEAQLMRMKPTAYLLNIARGGLIDEAALVKALDAGRLNGAALDVYATEPPRETRLLTHPKILLTPHLGASTREAQARIANEVIDVIKTVDCSQ